MTREEVIEVLEKEESYMLSHGGDRQAKALRIAIDKIEQEFIFSRILEKTYNDFCNCEGGEGWLKIDGKEYVTDAGYAIEGVEIFMEILKRRLAESEVE